MIDIIKGTKEERLGSLDFMRQRNAEEDKKITEIVEAILKNVRENGDKAVLDYTKQFDGFIPESIEVTKEELDRAYNSADKFFLESLEKAKRNIEEFHKKQLRQGFSDFKEDGVILGQRVLPLERVGIYVPGGTAAYPSSVLMNAIPAKIAGVKEIIMVTPPQRDNANYTNILAAARICGVDRIFKIGGAQAIGALGYGTKTIPKADKIVGPGNIFVATAKKLLFGEVDIDMIAGPSEILILADETAKPSFVACDLMSQAEHDKMASAILLTTSEALANSTKLELEKRASRLERKEILEYSLKNYGRIIICEDEEEMFALSNKIAPEHLEICLKNPMSQLGKIKNAGSVFLGNYSPEPLGDYFAGPNHILPTGATARFFSPLGVDSFQKRSSFIYYTENALEKARDNIVSIAEKEGLTAHGEAIKVRFE